MPTILKREKLKSGTWGQKKAWLVLTDSEIFFTTDEAPQPSGDGALWAIQLAAIHNVRAKKAFRAGIDVLEIEFTDTAGKSLKKSFERGSVAQWANAGTGTGRVEANSLASWELMINNARLGRGASESQPAPQSVADELAKLAALRATGVLTEEEFNLGKQRLLE